MAVWFCDVSRSSDLKRIPQELFFWRLCSRQGPRPSRALDSFRDWNYDHTNSDSHSKGWGEGGAYILEDQEICFEYDGNSVASKEEEAWQCL